MLNDVREPPLEDEFAGQPQTRRKDLKLNHPVLSPVGEPIADVKLFEDAVPDHTYMGGVAMAVAAGVFAIVAAMVLWVWL